MSPAPGSPEPFLSSAVGPVPIYLARCDAEGRYRAVNEAYAERLGSSAADLLGRPMREHLGESAWTLLAEPVAAALAGRDVIAEVALVLEHLGVREVTLALCPDYGPAGEVIGFLIADVDASERKRYQSALYRREREFQTIVENSPDTVARLDVEARHLYVNRAVEAMFGLRAEDCIGKTMAQLGFPAHVAEAYASAVRGVFESGRERAFNYHLTQRGRTQHYTARGIPECDPSGVVESVLTVTYDVTERTRALLERDALLVREKAARMQAEAAARARDEFLAIVSHELRSPLNGIQSWTHVLENSLGQEAGPVRRALAGIKLGVQQQVRLIEDLLDATLVMTGKLRLAHEPVGLKGVVQAAIESVRPEAEAKSLTLVSDLPGADVTLDGDADRIQQVVWNLLSNAVKFTPEGGRIEVALDQRGRDAAIVVRDNGRGIAPQFVPYLFDPFRQADESSTRRAGGIGLGLTLVRRLTELHGGRVEVQSAGENQGATFTVHLPVTVGGASEDARRQTVRLPTGASASMLRGRRIVLVDDQKDARDALAELLQQAGAQVTSFGSGREVVEHFGSLANAAYPQIVICDIAMPEQDGYETLQQLRAIEGGRADRREPTPAIALTAFSQHEDKVRALAHGFQAHLAKPVDPGELIGVIEALTRGPLGVRRAPERA